MERHRGFGEPRLFSYPRRIMRFAPVGPGGWRPTCGSHGGGPSTRVRGGRRRPGRPGRNPVRRSAGGR
eukprot:scaffold548045_cov19-Prasinocladus_malaysianus.AAC.1